MDDQHPPAAAPETTGDDPPPITVDEYAEHLTCIWNRVAEASAQLAADVTGTWWHALPVTRPGGFDMVGSAAVLAARMAKLGPDGDPLETITMSLIAYAQHAQAHALLEVEDIEQRRRALHDAE